MLDVGEAMTNGLPAPIYVPPQLLVYQRTASPEPPVTERLIFPASLVQKLFRSDSADVGATERETTVTLTLEQDEMPQALLYQPA